MARKILEWKKEYLNTNEKPIGEDYDLHTYLFATPPEVVTPYIAGLIASKDKASMFLGDSLDDAMRIASHLVNNALSLSSGQISLGRLIVSIQEVLKTWKRLQYYFNTIMSSKQSSWSKMSYPMWSPVGEMNDAGNERLFAKGELLEDYEITDSDPYLTAGGYRRWIAKAGSDVKYGLNRDLSITVYVEANCLVDHYNNNIGGVSTGNGTTRYEIGERVEWRVVTGDFGREIFDESWKNIPNVIKTRVQYLNVGRFISLAKQYQGELFEAVNNYIKNK